MIKKVIRAIWIGVILAAVLFIIIFALVLHKKNIEAAQKQEKATTEVSVTPEPVTTPSIEPEEKLAEIPVDFTALKEQNKDVYAYIHIDDTKVDYPILQSTEDDTYYLNHTIDHEEGYPGSIYTESANSQKFTDPNTVMYGHNMRDKSMFGSLHNFEDTTFFEEHPYVYIYLPDEVLTYEIFAAVEYSDKHILNSYDYTTKEGFQAYLDSLSESDYEINHYRSEAAATTDDTVLTLATCIGGSPDNRYLVVSKLIKREKGEQK